MLFLAKLIKLFRVNKKKEKEKKSLLKPGDKSRQLFSNRTVKKVVKPNEVPKLA